ncbi:Imm26 family immunity protein [Brevundimonas sp.]|uniref:Imm26 family immunity protein n=1 Tax=Brevundimonas sp. TaxID=1871086 RepID=UPI003BA93322
MGSSEPKTPRDPKLKGKRIAVKAGAVFEMPVPDGRRGYGIIIVGGGVPYVVILKTLHEKRPPLPDLDSDEIALVGWTMDSLIYHGRWTIIGTDNGPPRDVPFPNFRVNVAGVLQTTDFQGKVIGPSRPDEIALLDNQFSSSPSIYQDALMALNGIGEWKSHFDKLLPEYARARMTRRSDETRQEKVDDRNYQSGHRRLDLRTLARRLLS